MKLISRIVLVGLVSLNVALAVQRASISVATYGAKCDGVTDDRAAIQSALNAAAAAGGGTVTLPGSTCLLNSFSPSSFPWGFYNLHVPSNVTLQGVTGSKLLQGLPLPPSENRSAKPSCCDGLNQTGPHGPPQAGLRRLHYALVVRALILET